MSTIYPIELPETLAEMVAAELKPDERVEWMAQPKRIATTLQTTPIVIFGLFWTGFSVFWVAVVAGFKWPDFAKPGFHVFFPLFGVPFILIGLLMLSAPLFAWRKAGYTVYVITDRRALIFDGGRKTTIRSLWPGDVVSIYRMQKPDGWGDLVLNEVTINSSEGKQTAPGRIVFSGIEHVRDVEDLLRRVTNKV